MRSRAPARNAVPCHSPGPPAHCTARHHCHASACATPHCRGETCRGSTRNSRTAPSPNSAPTCTPPGVVPRGPAPKFCRAESPSTVVASPAIDSPAALVPLAASSIARAHIACSDVCPAIRFVHIILSAQCSIVCASIRGGISPAPRFSHVSPERCGNSLQRVESCEGYAHRYHPQVRSWPGIGDWQAGAPARSCIQRIPSLGGGILRCAFHSQLQIVQLSGVQLHSLGISLRRNHILAGLQPQHQKRCRPSRRPLDESFLDRGLRALPAPAQLPQSAAISAPPITAAPFGRHHLAAQACIYRPLRACASTQKAASDHSSERRQRNSGHAPFLKTLRQPNKLPSLLREMAGAPSAQKRNTSLRAPDMHLPASHGRRSQHKIESFHRSLDESPRFGKMPGFRVRLRRLESIQQNKRAMAEAFIALKASCLSRVRS